MSNQQGFAEENNFKSSSIQLVSFVEDLSQTLLAWNRLLVLSRYIKCSSCSTGSLFTVKRSRVHCCVIGISIEAVNTAPYFPFHKDVVFFFILFSSLMG